MATTNSIGSFTFLSLDGDPETLKEHLEVLERAGVDGVAIWKRGNRGRPFRLRSIVDSASLDSARGLFAQYTTLIGASPVALVWSSLNMGTEEDYDVAVLDVRAISIIPILKSVGGLNSPSGAVCECEWDLIPIEKT